MASAAFKKPEVFPNGASISVYPWHSHVHKGGQSGTPVDAALDTQVVAADQVTFANLTAGQLHWAVNGAGRWVGFVA